MNNQVNKDKPGGKKHKLQGGKTYRTKKIRKLELLQQYYSTILMCNRNLSNSLRVSSPSSHPPYVMSTGQSSGPAMPLGSRSPLRTATPPAKLSAPLPSMAVSRQSGGWIEGERNRDSGWGRGGVVRKYTTSKKAERTLEDLFTVTTKENEGSIISETLIIAQEVCFPFDVVLRFLCQRCVRYNCLFHSETLPRFSCLVIVTRTLMKPISERWTDINKYHRTKLLENIFAVVCTGYCARGGGCEVAGER